MGWVVDRREPSFTLLTLGGFRDIRTHAPTCSHCFSVIGRKLKPSNHGSRTLEGQRGPSPGTQEKWAVLWFPDRTDDLIAHLPPLIVVFGCCSVLGI